MCQGPRLSITPLRVGVAGSQGGGADTPGTYMGAGPRSAPPPSPMVWPGSRGWEAGRDGRTTVPQFHMGGVGIPWIISMDNIHG